MRDLKVAPQERGPRREARSILVAAMAALLINAGFASPAESQQVAVQAETGLPPQGEPPVQADTEEAPRPRAANLAAGHLSRSPGPVDPRWG